MNSVRELTPAMLMRFTQIDYDREMAFVAVRSQPGEDEKSRWRAMSPILTEVPASSPSSSPTTTAEEGLGRRMLEPSSPWRVRAGSK